MKESPANGKKMDRVIFDMDKDSKNDSATIIESIDEFSKFKLLIYLSNQKKQYEVELFHSEDFAIFPFKLKVFKDVLEVSYSEDNSTFKRVLKLRFNKRFKSIQVIGYDSSYRTSEGSCEKSYNLITGKYEVKNNILNISPKKLIKKTGIKKTKELFINNLNAEKVIELDGIGKEFELE